MTSRRFRRKYQSGGILPDYRGAQLFSKPQNINQNIVKPIEFDPTAVFQAVNARENNIRTAIARADLNRREREDAWTRDYNERVFLDKKISELKLKMESGIDELTKLDMNDPAQFQMAQKMRRQLEVLNNENVNILTSQDPMTPQERQGKLMENSAKIQSMYSDPNYIRQVQRNVIAKSIVDQLRTSSSSGELLDNGNVNLALDLVSSFKRGEIDEKTLISKLKPYKINESEYDALKTRQNMYLDNALDKDKMAANWEKLMGDDYFHIFAEKVRTPTLENVAAAWAEPFLTPRMKKVMEARGEYVDENGMFSEQLFMNHATRLVRNYMETRGLNPEGGEVVRTVKEFEKNVGRGKQEIDDRSKRIERDLNSQGLEILTPTILDEVASAGTVMYLWNIATKEEAENILNDDMLLLWNKIHSGGIKYNPEVKIKSTPYSREALSKGTNSFISLIDRAENGGTGNYDILYNNAQNRSFDGIKVSRMTVGELKDFANPSGDYGKYVLGVLQKSNPDRKITSTPMGRYQITGTTLKQAQKEMGFSDDEVFDAELQDAIAEHLLRKRLNSASTIEGKIKALRAEWEGFEKFISDEDLTEMINMLEDDKIKSEIDLSYFDKEGEEEGGVDKKEAVTAEQTSQQKIETLKQNKEKLVEENVFGDNIDLQLEAIDRKINMLSRDNEMVTKAITDISNLSSGEEVDINVGALKQGASSFLDPTSSAPSSPAKFKVKKASKGDLYRITESGRVIADKITIEQLEKYLNDIAGKTKSFFNKVNVPKYFNE